MRKKIIPSSAVTLLVIIFASNMISFGFTQDNWNVKLGMHEGRSGLGTATLNGTVYAIGGATAKGFCSFNEQYNLTTDTWAFKSPMPTARSAFAIASLQNRIYCIGGYCGFGGNQLGATSANEVYDPETDSWETKAPMLMPELNVRANVADGKIFVIGGNNNGTLNQVYDPATDSWTTKAPIPTAVSSYASAVAEDKIFVITNDLTQIYNARNNSWSIGIPAPSPVILANAAATTGNFAPQRIYVFGVDAQLPYWQLSTKGFITQCYDPNTDNWTACSSLQTGRYDVGITVVDDKLYLIGGFNTRFSSTELDPNPTYIFSTLNEQYTPIDYGAVPLTTSMISSENIASDATPTVAFALVGFGLSIFLAAVGTLAYLKKREKMKRRNGHQE